MDRNLPLISVVIPTYNEEKNISTCLNAILKQDYPQDKIEIKLDKELLFLLK